jgi:hypothetical protein
MKNGFNYQGEEVEVCGGSFGRAGVVAQAGVQNGNYSSYGVADSVHDDGWHDFSLSSPVNRIDADLGAGGDQTEFHLQSSERRGDPGAIARATLVDHLHLVADDAFSGRLPRSDRQLEAVRHVLDAGHRLLSRFLAKPRRRPGPNAQPCEPRGPLAGQLCIDDGKTPRIYWDEYFPASHPQNVRVLGTQRLFAGSAPGSGPL